jgi:methionine synthase I (cobalamin-dependent)
MTTAKERQPALAEVLEQRIPLLDAAMGSMLHQRITIADFVGPEFDNCCENLLRTRPGIILGIHRACFAAGAGMVETNSVGGRRITLADFKLQNSIPAAFTLRPVKAKRWQAEAPQPSCD